MLCIEIKPGIGGRHVSFVFALLLLLLRAWRVTVKRP